MKFWDWREDSEPQLRHILGGLVGSGLLVLFGVFLLGYNKGSPTVTTPTTFPLRPMRDRLILKTMEAPGKTAGGLFIPEQAKEVPLKGKVISTGPGLVDERGIVHALTVKPGDTVLYTKYAGTDFTLNEVTYLIITEADVLAVIEE